MKELKQGIKVEKEHRDLFNMIKHCKSPCRITEKKVYSTIAKAHLREDKNYYKKLREAGL